MTIHRSSRTFDTAYEPYALSLGLPRPESGATGRLRVERTRGLSRETPVLDAKTVHGVTPQPGAAHPTASPPGSPLPSGATTALRCWLQTQRRAHAAGAELRTADVRRALRPVCDAARHRGARVEQVIVLLKELWATIPPDELREGRGRAYPDARREVLDGIVRVCIEEYYAPDSDVAAWRTESKSGDGAPRSP